MTHDLETMKTAVSLMDGRSRKIHALDADLNQTRTVVDSNHEEHLAGDEKIIYNIGQF